MGNNQHEPLRNLALLIASIRSTGATGRLALRNTLRVGMLHLYFERGQLVRLEGGRASIDDAIVDLAAWTAGQIRFDSGVRSERQTITPGQQDFFERTLLFLQQQGVVETPPPLTPRFSVHQSPASPPLKRPPSQPRGASTRSPDYPISGPQPPESFTPPPIDVPYVSEGPRHASGKSSSPSRQERPRAFPAPPPLPPVVTGKAEVLVTSRQWELLVDVVRTMLEQVGQLFGQRQAQNILQHVLTEQGKQSEVLGLLQVDRQGWLREARPGEILTQPVQEVAGGFVLLISDFERRCASLLGEDKARQMIAQALSPYQEALGEIGIAINA